MEKSHLLIDRVETLLEIERRFHSAFHYHPIPSWIKFITQENKLVMGLVNEAYTEATGITIAAYYGKPDDAVWVDGTQEVFAETDLKVLRLGSRVRIAEEAENPLTKKRQVWVGWKWPYSYQNKVIGIWGCAHSFPKDKWENGGKEFMDSAIA